MTILDVLFALFIAICFDSWPILANHTGVGGGWISVIVTMTTALVILACSTRDVFGGNPPSRRAVLLLVVGGVMNGIGFILYAGKMSDQSVSPAAFIASVLMLMVICTPVLDWAVNGHTITGRQLCGFGLAAASIYLIQPR
jgi:drug/metabolite transporter (DMT)-like permease